MNAAHIERAFPGLRDALYEVTSPIDPGYNCIAWAAQQNDRWWWPVPDYYWPAHAPLECTLDVFRMTFAALGYTETGSADVEKGVEKIAIFTDRDLVPTHAARQLLNGRWTSKLGKLEDIEHDLTTLEGDEYGVVALVLARHGSNVHPMES